ncbi:MAG: class I SAM-dependent DNA methyltransferase [Candidatus Kariarchaeaceae archaeon]|jgi:ubiquinone/menaquinone biosynthesis C-methylase UbiE
MNKHRVDDEFMQKMFVSYPKVHNVRYWQEVSPFINEKSRNRCLDIGCGPGLLLRDLEEKFKPEMLYGIDLSQTMLQKAKEILSSVHQEGRLQIIQQNLQEDPTLPDDLDVIFSSRVMRSFEDQMTILHSIYSSLTKDGLFVLLDWDKNSIAYYYHYFKGDSPDTQTNISEVVRKHRNFSRYGIEDWEFMLQHVGFTVQLAFQVNEVTICIIAKKPG